MQKIRRGLGKPDIIYVKNFIVQDEGRKEPCNTDVSTEVGESDPNYTYYNQTDQNYTDMSYTNPINQSAGNAEGSETQGEGDRIDGIDEASAYMALIRDNLEYEFHMKYDQHGDKEMYEETNCPWMIRCSHGS